MVNLTPSIESRERAKVVTRAWFEAFISVHTSAILTESLSSVYLHEGFCGANRDDLSADNAWQGARQARERGRLPEAVLIA
jgi:hypothetical protein